MHSNQKSCRFQSRRFSFLEHNHIDRNSCCRLSVFFSIHYKSINPTNIISTRVVLNWRVSSCLSEFPCRQKSRNDPRRQIPRLRRWQTRRDQITPQPPKVTDSSSSFDAPFRCDQACRACRKSPQRQKSWTDPSSPRVYQTSLHPQSSFKVLSSLHESCHPNSSFDVSYSWLTNVSCLIPRLRRSQTSHACQRPPQRWKFRTCRASQRSSRLQSFRPLHCCPTSHTCQDSYLRWRFRIDPSWHVRHRSLQLWSFYKDLRTCRACHGSLSVKVFELILFKLILVFVASKSVPHYAHTVKITPESLPDIILVRVTQNDVRDPLDIVVVVHGLVEALRKLRWGRSLSVRLLSLFRRCALSISAMTLMTTYYSLTSASRPCTSLCIDFSSSVPHMWRDVHDSCL